MDYIKFHKVDSSANDTNITFYVNMDYVNNFITAATTVTLKLKGLDTDVEIMDDTVVITTDGIASTKLVADGLHSLLSSSYNSKAARTVGAGFNGASITTIAVPTAV